MKVNVPGLAAPLEGTGPVVILGANGSGKTRLAVAMAAEGDVELIPALRNIALPDQIPNWTLQNATNEFASRVDQRRNRYWELIQDIDALFGKLWSSHALEAMRVYDLVREGRPADTLTLTDTVLEKTKALWKAVFPGRSITFSDFSAKVTSEYLGSATYTAKQMSDGERTGLYLAARVFDTSRPVVVVDEPETHFHSRLAVRFWDALESLCPDKRFVFVTHDLTFALSRRDAHVVLARPNLAPQVVQPGEALPTEDFASILGAASFSVYAKRLVFCEGREEKSLDQEMLRAWFNDRDTALVPVGGCENVKRCTSAFSESSIVGGFEAVGIIDRDHWPDEMLGGEGGVHVLGVHEIESLYVLKGVYQAVAAHTGHGLETLDGLFDAAFRGFREQARGTLANRVIGERFRARSMLLIERSLGVKSDSNDRAAMRAAMVAQAPLCRAITHPGEVWDEEAAVVDAAVGSSDPMVFLKVLPGKPLVGPAATSLGLKKERYCELVRTALGSSDPTFAKFRKELEAALEPFLPSRRLASASEGARSPIDLVPNG